GITDKSRLSHIIEIHLVDAMLQDRREIESINLTRFKKTDTPNIRDEFLNAPSIVRVVRKCFQLRFGHIWSNYRVRYLCDEKPKLSRSRLLKLRFNPVSLPNDQGSIPKYLYK